MVFAISPSLEGGAARVRRSCLRAAYVVPRKRQRRRFFFGATFKNRRLSRSARGLSVASAVDFVASRSIAHTHAQTHGRKRALLLHAGRRRAQDFSSLPKSDLCLKISIGVAAYIEKKGACGQRARSAPAGAGVRHVPRWRLLATRVAFRRPSRSTREGVSFVIRGACRAFLAARRSRTGRLKTNCHAVPYQLRPLQPQQR